MKPQYRHICIIICFIMMAVPLLSANRDIDEIRRAIQAKGAQWTAGENWVTRLTKEERRALCGAILEPEDVSNAPQARFEQVDLPEKIDWRDNNGNWVTPVKNQWSCGSCWDFAAIAQIETWWKIYNANPDSMIDLSEQFVLSCGNVGTCESGGSPFNVLELARTVGVPSEDCMPYQADSNVPCSDVCPDWQSEAVTIPGWGWVTIKEIHVEAIKQAVYRAPVSTHFITYADFDHYAEGVYEHVWGDTTGGHFVLIVGWDDMEQCWICKNSWGPAWGENGFFRIKWGECGIGSDVKCIWSEIEKDPNYVTSLTCDSLTLTTGDSAELQITIKNMGSSILECNIADAGFKLLFHSDDFMSYDGFSIWCGDPDLAGYPDWFMENLDTPLLDLTGTANPKLTFMTQWAIESPTAYKTYDGWDGCNVWISEDGGENFTVLWPSYPQYTCTNLWSFSTEMLWGFDDSIPGWADSSGGWVPVEFDLSEFTSESVVIRFSFAADLAWCTMNQSDLTGFFIDEIKVTDNGVILYENHGSDLEGMRRSGIGTNEEANWLNPEQYYISVEPVDSAEIPVFIHTHLMEPGDYYAGIFVLANDTLGPANSHFFNLTVEAAEHDIALKSILSPGEFMPILCPITPQVRIKNIGKNTESGFGLALELSVDNMPAYTDTVSNLTLASMQSMTVAFDPMVLTDKADYEMNVYPVDLPEDNNLLNNGLEKPLTVSNLIDDFESEPVLWTIDRDWKIAESQTAYEGTHCATIRADNDSDAVLIFNPALDLSLADQARIQYRIRSGSSEGQQICYFEISLDSLSWTRADSVTGKVEWELRQVDLTPMIETGHDNLWFRFYYHTEKVRKKDVFWIDNIEIYPEGPSGIERDRIISPYTWNLAQNYPNPFNPVTNIQYTLPVAAHVEIRIFNTLGQQVASLIDEKQTAGAHRIQWDGSGFPSGLYFYQIQAGEFCDTKKCLMLK